MNRFSLLFISFIFIFFTACSTRGFGTYLYEKQQGVQTYFSNGENHIESKSKKKYTSPVNNQKYTPFTMRPYIVRGVKYYPTVVSVGDEFHGRASWYGPDFHGKLTSNGERYNMYSMTAAHKTLPMNTIVKVTNLNNGRSAIVRINDRGPFVATRIIDLSKVAASKIGMIGTGTAPVSLKILGFESKGKKKIPTNMDLKKSVQKKSIDNFALQIASFTKIDGAIRTQEKYDNINGYTTIIKDIQTNHGRMFKVWLQGFRSKEEAHDYRLKGHFKGAFIVRGD